MKSVGGDIYELSTGRRFSANCGYIGLSHELRSVSEGYDGHVCFGEHGLDTPEECWTAQERQELGDYMIALWAQWRDGLGHSAPTVESTELDAAWSAIEHGWSIEPRAYFEKEAPTNGFKFPLAQAIHHLWKRELKERKPEMSLCSKCNRPMRSENGHVVCEECVAFAVFRATND